MSADSPRRVTRKGSAGHVVLPQPVSDPSLIDSVTGFIHEVVPQYSSGAGDSRGQITWARVQQADINDPALYPDTGEQDGVPPLLIVLGYGSGVQVWMVGVSGEAREVLSWSQGSVRSLVVLPSPEPRARQDLYRHKRPLVSMVDNAGPGPQFCSVSFISLRDGDQVKSIKFSHQVWEVVASRRCVAVTLSERIAVFDAATLEDSLVVTTCYPSPDINPIALGSRWLAYADRRLVSRWKSAGGCHAEGPHSVTATVFHAAKCLGKGLRDLGGTVASSLTGTSPDHSHSHANAHVIAAAAAECLKGVVTILDIESKLPKDVGEDDQSNASRIVAHFNAHSEPIVALAFDPSGLLLASADKRGHRFHVFRINPHASGPTLAHIQHLYVLHRGDTTARIQDIAFSEDSRWVAVSSLRGTTHVFPITPYGGTVGVRTHTTPHVVNKLSRFHRSAGLTDEGRSSPVLWEGSPTPPPVPCLPTASVPTTVTALAQVRRQSALAPPTEESIIRVAACFGAPRAPGLVPLGPARPRRCTDSLFVMACSGTLIQYDLEPRPLSGVTKERICDDTGVELHVTVRGEWLLQRPPYSSALHPPLPCTNPLLTQPDPPTPTEAMPEDERWLSQVEIVTHAGPHRRLWMGPQFTFITLSSNNEAGETLDITKQMVRSSPVNMPLKQALVIESGSGSCSSLELSPSMVELVYKTDCSWSCRLREDLAEAMQETTTRALDTGCGVLGEVRREPVVERQVNPTGSVVTLTARLDSPIDLEPLTATVVGTETKTITLESRASKPVANASVELVTIASKVQKNCDYNTKNGKKVLAEADENVSANTQRKSEEKEPAVETPEKRGKNGKVRRKISKGEKNKVKLEVENKTVEEVLAATVDVSGLGMASAPDEMPLPVYEGLQSCVDIEMQLREASAEPEDSRGRKRSLDTAVEHKANCILLEPALTPGPRQEQSNTDDLKENDKANSRLRKKSRNDKEGWANKNVVEDRGAEEKVCEPANEYEINSAPEKVAKPEEKTKNKKKRSKKSAGLNEVPSEETQFIRKDSFEMKKTDDSDIETLLLEVSQKTICPETPFLSSEFKVENYEKQREDTILEDIATTIKSTDEVSDSISIENEIADINRFEEKSVTTDDELKGFESDLLVKDSGWSPEKSPEHGQIDILMEDKDSDKEIDKIKNDETTDKDSSDDCQPVVVKNDMKSVQKRGKNRKLRKNREMEYKITDEAKREESELKTDVTEVEVFLVNEDKDLADSVLEEANKEIKKLDSEEEEFFIEIKKKGIEEESFPEIKFSTDGIKRRIRKRDSPEKEEKIIQPELDPPKRSWSSIVASVGEDPNGNVTKSEEPIVPVRSWSSIAAGTAKSKSQETDITKTNSVEDRDSVYESCNDSVGEEAEPSVSLDSLASCYYEPEPQTDYIKDEAIASSESKNGSSVEDKSNTDSGEKDDLIIGVQTATKKSKKQKKKKR